MDRMRSWVDIVGGRDGMKNCLAVFVMRECESVSHALCCVGV